MLVLALALAAAVAPIMIDYPAEGSVFPPEFPPPTFLWRDAAANAVVWVVETENGVRVKSAGERMSLGRIDPRAVASTNKPLASTAIPLIAWRLRNVGETASRLLMEGLHTCANSHSFSGNGKTMGLDVDGPQNDKGLYALVAIRPRLSSRGEYLVTTINDPGVDESEHQRRKNLKEVVLNYYVANFKDYRFLQVFYPTRGILAWYDRAAGGNR